MRLKACLAAALAALLALAPLSAMASDDPLADLAQAKADLKAAKAALVGYEGTGVLGFYRHEGATDAVRVLTDPSVTKYQDHIRLDDPDGPTALSKVRSALEFVEECNRLRAGEGLDALEASDTAMAVAEAQDSYYMYDEDWNENDGVHHKMQFGVGENLDSSGDDPFDIWYTDEKADYEEQKADGIAHPVGVGHYLAIIHSHYTATGFADGSSNNTDYRVQDFTDEDTIYSNNDDTALSVGPTYTPAEYLKRLDDYQTWYDGLIADRKAANRAVDKARAALRHVSGTVRSTDGAPVADATVTLSDGSSSVSGTTGSDGSFDVKAPSDGTWTLAVTADGYLDGTVGPIVIGDGQTRVWSGLDARLKPAAAEVSGTVTDTDGAPITGVRVDVVDSKGPASVLTGSDGTWSASVAPGDATVSYPVMPDGYEAVTDTSKSLDLEAGDSAVFDLKVRLKDGSVTVAATDPGGPIQGVGVTVDGLDASTDEKGAARIDGLRPGWHKVSYTVPDGLRAGGPDETYVPAGGTVRLAVSIKAKPLSAIPTTGRVPWVLLSCLAALPLAAAALGLRRHADLG